MLPRCRKVAGLLLFVPAISMLPAMPACFLAVWLAETAPLVAAWMLAPMLPYAGWGLHGLNGLFVRFVAHFFFLMSESFFLAWYALSLALIAARAPISEKRRVAAALSFSRASGVASFSF